MLYLFQILYQIIFLIIYIDLICIIDDTMLALFILMIY